jgi:hypothetical protein
MIRNCLYLAVGVIVLAGCISVLVIDYWTR